MGQFILKTRVYLGKEGLDEILTGVSRAFIVTDKFMHESGMVGYLTEPMEKKGVQYQIFSDVKPDPDIATVTKGIGQLLDFKPQVLFALGGGSSIDAAKAMNWPVGERRTCREDVICGGSYHQRHRLRGDHFRGHQRSAEIREVSSGIRRYAAGCGNSGRRAGPFGTACYNGGYGHRCADACD